MPKNNSQTVEDVLTYMNSLSRRNKLFREMDIRVLRIVRADLCRTLELREAELREEQDKEKERQNKIGEHLQQLKKDGIEPDELIVATRSKKRPSIGPIRTYRIGGELVHYKGVGKYPGKLKEVIDSEGEAALARYEVLP